MAHTIKALLSHYDAAFRQKFGAAAPLVPSKDTALAKRLLAMYTLEQLTGWVDRFFASTDPFILKSGYTFGVFHSQVGKLIVSGKRRREDAPVVTDSDRRAAWQRDERNRLGAQDMAEEFYRTHPWAKRPTAGDVQ